MVAGAGDGDRHRATARALEIDGAPVFPRSGEIHYSRIPRDSWGRMLRAAAAGGLTHVATYVLWNHHEPVHGEVSFADGLDLRAFLETARAAGLGIVLRIGPYAHAEARHGGLPDWLVDAGIPLRRDDPAYLAVVRDWYARIAAEADGIPLFAIQVDNELYDQPGHLATLRRLAEEVGLHAPYWVATGWGAARLPDDVLPTFGGYPDSFWIEASQERDHRSLSNFEITPRRDDDGIGADHRESEAQAAEADERFPFLTCELGGGMVSAYHRRPSVSAADIDALALAKLASGSSWQGYYMYADGRNPRPGLQESHALGEPNDFVEISYDFGAALTVDAVPRRSWARLRRQHLLLDRWGSALAAMPPTFAPDDTAAGLRWSVRSDGSAGFVFVVNHEPRVARPARRGVRFEVARPAGTVRFPEIDVPPGAAFVWPFALPAGEAAIAWATAQPVTEVVWRDAPLLVFAATPGVEPAFEVDGARLVVGDGAAPGVWHDVVMADGHVTARLLVLDDAESVRLGVDAGRLVLSDGVPSAGSVDLADHVTGDTLLLQPEGWRRLAPPAPRATSPVEVRRLRDAGAAPHGGAAANGRASIPTDWSGAARFAVVLGAVPESASALVLDWTGDVARAFDGDRLVSDALWNGREWRIPASDLAGLGTLAIEVLPLASDAPVHIVAGRPQGAELASVAWHERRALSLG